VQQILLRIPLVGLDRVLTLYGYGLAMCLGFLAAIMLASWRARREGQPTEVVHNAALAAFVGGILGARLFFVVQYTGGVPSLWELLKIWEGGLTFYGGFVLAVLAVGAYLALTRRPLLYWLDVFAPSVALGLAFGRLGCYLNGCCYGDVCDSWAGMAWPAGTIPWQHYADLLAAQHGLAGLPETGPVAGALAGAAAAVWQPPPLVPTQLISLVNALLLAFVCDRAWGWKRRHGQVIVLFVILYGISRFLLEMLRADEAEAWLLGLPTLLSAIGLEAQAARLPGLTISQNVAIVLVLGGTAAWVLLARSRRPALDASFVPAEPETQPQPKAKAEARKRR
jgi:phosphatidylglycerol:prolipoprotein diacylglycerol transferase